MLAGMIQSALSILTVEYTSRDKNFNVNQQIDYSKDYIIHAHRKIITDEVDPTKTILIQSKRHNLLNTILSEQLALKTTQWNKYRPLTPEPFTFSKAQFHRRFLRLMSWYDDIDTTKPWHKVVELYYEDLVTNGHSGVAELLGVPDYDVTVPITSKQSLHKYQDWIINLEELTEFYESLNTPSV